MVKNVRVLFQWAGIALLLLLGTGGYLWYRASAGITTNKTPIPSEMSASGLVGYWTFDGADYSSATVITDKSGNSHSGTLTNAPTKTTGKWGQALDFPGSNQYVSVGSVYNGVKTVAFWIWADSTTKNIIDLNATATIDVSSGTIRGNNFTSPTIYIDGIASSTPTIDTAGWHFVVITTGTGINASAVDIGRISTGYFDGRLDDVRMYSGALSASAIYQLYTAGSAKVNAPPEDPLSQSLRGYWKLDDGSGTNATDSSGNGNTLAMTGSPSWTTGNIGPYALDFSGSGQYLSVADPASGVLDIRDSTDFSVTGWFNRDTFANDHTIVAKRNSSATNTDAGYIVWIDAAADKLNFTVGDGGGTAGDQYTLASTSTFTATGWHQFTAVWDDSLGMQLYIDGKLDNSTTSSTSSIGSLANAVAFRIGAESDAGNPFDGKLDDIRIYGYALSADQVKKIYNTTAPTQPVDTSLVGHWTFDGPDIQGSTAIDRSSFGNNGTITGTTKTIGKLGQALSFNGSSDHVILSSEYSLESSDSSFVAWIQNRGNVGDDTIIEQANAVRSAGWDFFVNSNLVNFIYASSVDSIGLTGTQDLSDEGWHHIVVTVTISNGVGMLYEDGVLTDTDTFIGSLQHRFQIPAIGSTEDNGNFFNGSLDDIRIYKRALLSTEVTDMYNVGR